MLSLCLLIVAMLSYCQERNSVSEHMLPKAVQCLYRLQAGESAARPRLKAASVQSLQAHADNSSCRAVAYTLDGANVISGGEDSKLVASAVESGKQVYVQVAHCSLCPVIIYPRHLRSSGCRMLHMTSPSACCACCRGRHEV